MTAQAELKTIAMADEPGADRRSGPRHQLVLRVGLLEQDGRSIFCLVKNISSAGVQVRPYGRLTISNGASLRVGDEDPITGTVAWCRDGLAGVEFDEPLDPQALLRIGQKMAGHKRRHAPRVATDLTACLRTGGRRYSVTLCDVSMVGARLRGAQPIAFGETTMIEVAGLPSLKVYLRWSEGAEHGVSFDTPLPMQIIADILSGLKSPRIV